MKTLGFVASTPLIALLFAAPAEAQSAPVDIKTLCGSKPAVVALTDGVGDNAFRRIAKASFEEEAAKCPNITKVLYADAGGDQQKSNSDINSLVAQGANIIVSFVDFGDSMLPAFRKATAAGVVVIPYQAALSGKAGRDYAANLHQNTEFTGSAWADWAGQNLKKGNVLYVAGAPATPVDVEFGEAIKKTLKKYPDLHLLQDDYVVTNWNPSDAHKAITAAIAKYGKIDFVIADYSIEAKATVQAFEEAKLPLPAIATISPSNDLDCLYNEYKKAGKEWKFLEMGGTINFNRGALRRGLAIYEGTDNPEPLLQTPVVVADTFKGIDPKCDPSLPPDADLSAELAPETLKALLKK